MSRIDHIATVLVVGARVADVPVPEYDGLCRRTCSRCNSIIWLAPQQAPSASLRSARAAGMLPVLACIQCALPEMRSGRGLFLVDATDPDFGLRLALMGAAGE